MKVNGILSVRLFLAINLYSAIVLFVMQLTTNLKSNGELSFQASKRTQIIVKYH